MPAARPPCHAIAGRGSRIQAGSAARWPSPVRSRDARTLRIWLPCGALPCSHEVLVRAPRTPRVGSFRHSPARGHRRDAWQCYRLRSCCRACGCPPGARSARQRAGAPPAAEQSRSRSRRGELTPSSQPPTSIRKSRRATRQEGKQGWKRSSRSKIGRSNTPSPGPSWRNPSQNPVGAAANFAVSSQRPSRTTTKLPYAKFRVGSSRQREAMHARYSGRHRSSLSQNATSAPDAARVPTLRATRSPELTMRTACT